MRSPKGIVTIVTVLALFIVGRFFFPIEKPPHVQLPAEPLFSIAGITITNTMMAAWATIVVLALLFLFATRNMSIVPSRLQSLGELAVEFILNLCTSVAGAERARKFFTLCASLFLFILVSNWMGLLPGYGTVGIWHEEKANAAYGVEANSESQAHGKEVKDEEHGEGKVFFAFFRSANTDLNTTIALALITVLATQFYGIRALGAGYFSRFFSLKGPIDLVVGLLESISELAKIVSLSFRLFGNIFAGEVLLGVMAFLVPWIVSIPFMGLELFVGLMQAFVFMMLTLVFLTIGTTGHGAEHGKEHGGSH